MIVEMKGSAGGRVWLYNWFGGESVWICASRVAVPGIIHCLPRTSTSSSEYLKVTRLMCKWPSTLTLYLTVCVCLSLPVSRLWRALWPHGWVMRCLVWRLRTNKHSALFYSTHLSCAHCSVEDRLTVLWVLIWVCCVTAGSVLRTISLNLSQAAV